jgi:hypothetical protein
LKYQVKHQPLFFPHNYMIIKSLRLFLFGMVLLVASCKDERTPTTNTTNSTDGAVTTDAASSGYFFFSDAPSVPVHDDTPANLCRHPFKEGVPFFPVANDTLSRIVGITKDGWYRLHVRWNGLAALILKKTSTRCEVFTHVNFPRCLVNRAACSLTEGGQAVHYQGDRGMYFDLSRDTQGRFILRIPPNKPAGLETFRCEDCQ